jgi:proteasome assembly chaperone (PAC2) family protein
MDPVRRFSKPVLHRPKAVIAFEGWNDACDAASGAVNYLLSLADVHEPFAVVDPEEFFDFQSRRPTVQVDQGGTRSLTWPATKFFAVERTGEPHDLVLVLGEEPHLRWKTFVRSVTRVLAEMDVEEVVLLGAFIGEVAHTRPVPIAGVATDPEILRRHNLAKSSYEGPTGIVGVLQEACKEVGLPAMSLWAATPHYLAANPNPKAMLALLRSCGDVLGIGLDTDELETVAEEFSRRVEEAVRSSSDFAGYVEDLEQQPLDTAEAGHLDAGSSDELVTEIEDYLRKRT